MTKKLDDELEDLSTSFEVTIQLDPQDVMDGLLAKSIQHFDTEYLEITIALLEEELEDRMIAQQGNYDRKN